jgi:oligoribonuclease NrnB/cAMP/cGMP phosphodiesterase (DHH superfamily)
MKPLCIYHGNCADGFGAAWVFKNYADREHDFHAGVYQDAPPDCAGRDVYLVDFSYKRAVVEEICKVASRVVLIDHHKTAIDDLAPLIADKRIEALTSLENSGAVLAYKWFNGNGISHIPKLLLHIEDRDLWRFALQRTREIQANVFSYPYDFAVWDELMKADPQELAKQGEAIERKHFKDIAELVKVCRREMVIGGITVPVASLPYTLTSDAGHLMATEHASKIGVCYWDTPQGRVFSLRSTDDGPDVSEIAKQYGGGGHAHASGFRVPFGHELTK